MYEGALSSSLSNKYTTFPRNNVNTLQWLVQYQLLYDRYKILKTKVLSQNRFREFTMNYCRDMMEQWTSDQRKGWREASQLWWIVWGGFSVTIMYLQTPNQLAAPWSGAWPRLASPSSWSYSRTCTHEIWTYLMCCWFSSSNIITLHFVDKMCIYSTLSAGKCVCVYVCVCVCLTV